MLTTELMANKFEQDPGRHLEWCRWCGLVYIKVEFVPNGLVREVLLVHRDKYVLLPTGITARQLGAIADALDSTPASPRLAVGMKVRHKLSRHVGEVKTIDESGVTAVFNDGHVTIHDNDPDAFESAKPDDTPVYPGPCPGVGCEVKVVVENAWAAVGAVGVVTHDYQDGSCRVRFPVVALCMHNHWLAPADPAHATEGPAPDRAANLRESVVHAIDLLLEVRDHCESDGRTGKSHVDATLAHLRGALLEFDGVTPEDADGA